MSDRRSLAALVLAFALLWIPLGQHNFLTQHWMKVGTFMAPFLVLVAFSFSDKSIRLDARAVSLVLLVVYIIHQFEEHWVDIYGRTYAFKPNLNEFLSGLLGHSDVQEIMSDTSVFVINTSLVWLVGALAIWRGSQHVFAALCMASIVVINAVSHIGAALIAGSYNPGLLTGVVLFLPVGIGAYVWLGRTSKPPLMIIAASLAWGLIAHVLMISGVLALNRFDQFPEIAYFAVVIAWSLLPAFAPWRRRGD
ncbi:MAG: HXXEE domain-containing protein [Pseudomonadota bacterium]